jgi:hypothetical protein
VVVGAYEHGGIRASGVAADLELGTRFGLRFHLRDQTTLAPCDDGTALAFDASLERTVEHLRPVVGDADAEAYRRFAGWAAAGAALLAQTDHGPPPTLRELAALAEAALGPQAGQFLQALLGSASDLVRSVGRRRAPPGPAGPLGRPQPAVPGRPGHRRRRPCCWPGATGGRLPAPPAAPGPPSTRWSAVWRRPRGGFAAGRR